MAQTRESVRRVLATNYGLLGRTWCRYIAAVVSVSLAGWPWCRRVRAVNAIEADRLQRPAGVAIAAQKACASREQGRGLLGLHREGRGCRRWPGTPRATSSRGGAVAMQQMGRGTEERRQKMQARGFELERHGRRDGQHKEGRRTRAKDRGPWWGVVCPANPRGDGIPAWRCWLPVRVRGGEHRPPSSMTSIRPAGQAHGP
jgi:hypothetical protein